MVSIDLRHPDLRLRDIRRILTRQPRIDWESGTTADTEWVYVSLEDVAHRQLLLDWLASKDIADSAEALLLFDGHYESESITWGELRLYPERFFGARQIRIVSKVLNWRLDYRQRCVARFGRWKSSRGAAI